MKLNWNFPERGGCSAKQKPSEGGSMDFFLELHNANCTVALNIRFCSYVSIRILFFFAIFCANLQNIHAFYKIFIKILGI